MANKIQDAFDHVKADPGIKESTMRFLADKRREKKPFFPRLPVRRSFLAAVCVMAVLILGAGGYSWLLTPVSYVSIDVNPSVELGLNRLDQVVSVTAYNPQGEELLETLQLKGRKYVQAIFMLTENDTLQQYLASDEELVITLAADGSREHALKAGIEKCCARIGHGCRSVSVNMEAVSEAHGNGLSVGKYSAYLQLAQYDDSVTVDDCRNMSMAEIHCRILEHTHGSGHGQEQEGDMSKEHLEEKQETGSQGHHHRGHHE